MTPAWEYWSAMVEPHTTNRVDSSQQAVDVIYIAYLLSLSRNTTRYQHSMALARRFRLEVILAKGPCPEELAANAKVLTCPGGGLKILGRFCYFVGVLFLLVRARYRASQGDKRLLVITTHQPLCILAGAIAQRVLGMQWVADIFDVPALGLEITQKGRTSWINSFCSLPRIMITEGAYRVLKNADLVLCTLVPDALARCSIPPERIVALTNGVELHPYAAAPRGNVGDVFEVLYVGAVLRIRGVDTMLDACRIILDRVPGLRLSLVGPSEPGDQKWLHRRVAELELDSTVSITGELPHDEVLRRVRDADLCLFPFPRNYATEFIYPVKVLEYIAAGRTVIASDLPGVNRIIEDGRSGILVKPDDPQALADAIYNLWKSPELRRSLAANARAAAPKFEWTRINGQMLDALLSISAKGCQ